MSIPALEPITVTNLFTNPDSVAEGSEIVVWENLIPNPSFEENTDNLIIGSETSVSQTSFENAVSTGSYALSVTTTEDSSVSNGYVAQRIDLPSDSAGKWLGFSLIARRSSASVYASLYVSWVYSGSTSGGTYAKRGVPLTNEPNSEQERNLVAVVQIPEDGPDRATVWYRLSGTEGDHTPPGATVSHIDSWVAGVAKSKEGAEYRAKFYFDDQESPDPDLIPRKRSGGGSELVGMRIANHNEPTGDAVLIQSSQYSKSEGISARLLRIDSEGGGYARLISYENVNTLQVWRYQEKPLTPTQSWFGGLSIGSSNPGTSDIVYAPNEAGEKLLVVHRSKNDTDSLVFAGHFSDIGESLYFDKFFLSEDIGYDGPPFSGDTEPFLYKGQMVYPFWNGEPHESTSSFNYYPALEPWELEVDWDGLGQRVFEIGVDRGMLYLDGEGEAWSGLISVDRQPDGEESDQHYIDGVKYRIDTPPSDYSATIEAFTYPPKLEECLGSVIPEGHRSLRIHGQPTKPFHYAYRTRIGDDISGTEKGYKLHLVYNAYATPQQNRYATLGDMLEASTFSFAIETVPEKVPGFRPTSYISIDSTTTNPVVLENLEKVLYGTEGVPPYLPPISEIMEYLEEYS